MALGFQADDQCDVTVMDVGFPLVLGSAMHTATVRGVGGGEVGVVHQYVFWKL
jgi:hypothetical protein